MVLPFLNMARRTLLNVRSLQILNIGVTCINNDVCSANFVFFVELIIELRIFTNKCRNSLNKREINNTDKVTIERKLNYFKQSYVYS